MRFRKLTGFAAGAVVLGGLAVPALFSPAEAAVTSTAGITTTCGTGQQSSTYAPMVTLKLSYKGNGATLSASFTDMANGAPVAFVNFPGATIANKLVVTVDGTDVELTGTHTADYIGQQPIKMPAATGELATRPSSIQIKSYWYSAHRPNGGTQIAAQDCVLAAPVPVSFADESQVDGINGTCTIDLTESGFGGLSTYPVKIATTGTVPATGRAGSAVQIPVETAITFGREFSDYISTSPTKKVTGSVSPALSFGTKAATGTMPLSVWNRTLTPGSPGSAIGQPVPELITLTGTGTATATPTASGAHAATLTGLTGSAVMTVTFGDAEMAAPMECELDDAQVLGSTAVAAAPVVAKATKTTVKAKANSKKKTAVITVTVTNKATGKAKISVKGAGTKVAKTVTVKNGKATLKLSKKQLKKKGKRTVSVSFLANSKFKASKGKTTFKLK